MEHLHGYFVAAAYAVFFILLAADFLAPRMRQQRFLRSLRLRERRANARKSE